MAMMRRRKRMPPLSERRMRIIRCFQTFVQRKFVVVAVILEID